MTDMERAWIKYLKVRWNDGNLGPEREIHPTLSKRMEAEGYKKYFIAGYHAAIDAALKLEPDEPASEVSILKWGELIASLKGEE